MTKLICEFFEKNKGKKVRIFLANGFQMHGEMVEVDGRYLKFKTEDYGNTSKEILVSLSSITTFIPG